MGKTLRDIFENCSFISCLDGENIEADILLREMMRLISANQKREEYLLEGS